MSKSEKRLTEDCLCFESLTGSILFRNDNGMGYRKNGVSFTYGLGVGSGDQLGWKEKIITADMIGQKVAVFQSVEIKTITDRISLQQLCWYLHVKNAGGIAQVYTEDRFLTHEGILSFPRRIEKNSQKQAKYEGIIKYLTS